MMAYATTFVAVVLAYWMGFRRGHKKYERLLLTGERLLPWAEAALDHYEGEPLPSEIHGKRVLYPFMLALRSAGGRELTIEESAAEVRQ